MLDVTQTTGTFTLVRKFEQLSLFWQFVVLPNHEGAESMSTGLIDGEMEIAIDPGIEGGDWHISDVWVSVENFKNGNRNRASLVHLDGDRDERFMLLVLDALDHEYATRIEAWVQDELSTARYAA